MFSSKHPVFFTLSENCISFTVNRITIDYLKSVSLADLVSKKISLMEIND